jgi:hypothetical protein
MPQIPTIRPIVNTAIVTQMVRDLLRSPGGGSGQGPFPAATSTVRDTFTGTAAALAANWSKIDGGAGFNTISYGAGGTTGVRTSASPAFAWCYYTPTLNYGPDCEAFVTLPVVPAGQVLRLGARVISPGTLNYSGYFVHVHSDGVWTVRRVTNGAAPVTLATGPTLALAAGDSVGIRIVGTVVSAWYKAAAGAWQQMMSYDVSADATKHLGAGAAALEFQTQEMDNFAAGTLT